MGQHFHSINHPLTVQHFHSINHPHKSMPKSSNKSMSSNHTMRQSSSDNSYSVTVGSMKSIGMIRYCSHIGSKSLGLGHCSVFSLERLGDRLVGSLTSPKSSNYSTYKGTP